MAPLKKVKVKGTFQNKKNGTFKKKKKMALLKKLNKWHL